MITHKQALDYECRSSPGNFLLGFVLLPKWAVSALGSYYAWKVNRKMRRYLRYFKPPPTP